MGILNIVEFVGTQQFWTNTGSQVAVTPVVTTQSLTTGASSTVSASFTGNTNLIRLQANASCAISLSTLGTTVATANATSMYLEAGIPEYFWVRTGELGTSQVLAVIAL